MSSSTGKPEIASWGDFSTPVFSTRYPRPDGINAGLKKYILGQEAQGEKFRNPEYIPSNQVNIFESSFDLFKEPAPVIQELKMFFMHGIVHAVAQTNGYSLEACEKLRVITDAWYHVTHFGGYISSHTHPNASWSAVYMVDPGEQPENMPKGGLLNFKDPRFAANMYLDPGNQNWKKPYHFGSINFEMRPGDLLVFPAYIQHEVTPYYGQLPRITVAANCSFRWQDEVANSST
jgi:uncharacterized protein (TIGR02466 family)